MANNYNERLIEIGLNVKHFRMKKGYTQQQLADLIFISKQQLSRLESPNCTCSTKLETLFAIADALEINICQLLSTH